MWPITERLTPSTPSSLGYWGDKLQQALTPDQAATRDPVWTPQHREGCSGGADCTCPQVRAYHSEADVIGIGAAAGGGKTDLLLGMAGTQHRRSIIFRREFPRLEGIVARSREIFAQGQSHRDDSFNESLHRWSLENGKRTIQLAAMQHEEDKYNFQGRPYDGYMFDELPEFTETQFRFVTAWNRTTVPDQKCRVVVTFNPPMDETQEWVTRYFAPWLDETYPRPAQDGELRWYAMLDGKEIECESGAPFPDSHGDWVQPKSRTFFHAYLKDNPILERTGYGATIDALPEPLRSVLKGNFAAIRTPNPWQVIPTAWVRAAMERGKKGGYPPGRLTGLGVDVARGGSHKTTLAPVSGVVFGELIKVPGALTPDGPSVAALVVNAYRPGALVALDVVGVGSSAYDSLVAAGLKVLPFNGGATTDFTDRSGMLRMRNLRSAAYWAFREALDPENGYNVVLPDDPELLADLTAPRFRVVGGRVEVESKDDDPVSKKRGITSRLGRSPDCGDAVVMGWWANTFPVEVTQVVHDPVRIGSY